MHVPVRNIAAWMLQYLHRVIEAWHQVDPLLIDKQAGPALVVTEREATLFPPAQEPVRLGGAGNRDESQVEDTVNQVQNLVVWDRIIRRETVGNKNDPIFIECAINPIQ